MKLIRKITASPLFFPTLLLAACWLAYGYQIGKMGFYWDDWQLVFLTRLNDADLFWNYYAYDRPFAAWPYVLTAPWLGSDPVKWQVFTLTARWIGLLGFWFALKGIWPRRTHEISWMVLLLAVYPGFSQQSIAITYSLFFILCAFFTFSLFLMISAVRNPRRYILFTIPAVLLSFVHLMGMEYLFGLELLRPLFLWFILRDPVERKWKTLDRVIKNWLPYLAVVITFLVWRFIIYPNSGADPEANTPLLLLDLLRNPTGVFLHLLRNVTQDFLHGALFVWGKVIQPSMIDFSQKMTWFSWTAAALFAALAAVMLLIACKDRDAGQEKDAFAVQALLVGLVGFLLGGAPVWATDRQMIVGMWSDRFSLGPMFGAAILVVAVLAWLSEKKGPRSAALAVFLALGLAAQLQTVNTYKQNWDAQKDYYWQLFWRAPALKPGTAVLGTKIPFGLNAEYSVGFALNTIYAPDLEDMNPPYWFFSAVSDRGGKIVDYIEGLPLEFDLRSLKYESTTSQGVAVHYKYGLSCLHVLTLPDVMTPGFSDDEKELIAISHPRQIMDSGGPANLPVEIFGVEPPHSWCYYYQKADLARQYGRWQDVIQINREAEKAGFQPNNGVEYAPLIESLTRTGDWEEAASVTLKAVELTGSYKPYYCSFWERLSEMEGGSGEGAESVVKIRRILECSIP
jgi:hypothetical protein